jgi:hypothetical protein
VGTGSLVVGLILATRTEFLQSVLAMDFDPRSFCRTVNEKGRAYQHRALELIRICTVFSVASEQSLHQSVRLQR